jgi:hypothetical protein
MKTTVKARCSIRAISPVISVLLMIAIAVAAALVAYAWIMGYMGGTTTKVGKAILIQSVAMDVSNNLHVYVQNVGQGSVTIGSIYLNDVLQPFNPDPNYPDNLLNEGKTADLTITGLTADAKSKVKVVTTDGTFSEHTGSGTSSGTSYGPVTSLTVTPDPTSVSSGNTVTFSATASDGVNNWDVSTSASWTIDAGAGGSWLNNVYTSATAGTWTVTASYAAQSDTSTLTVNNGPASSLSVTPDPSSVTAGAAITFSATASDGINNWDVSTDPSTAWSISAGAGGSWSSNVYTSQNTGTWTVTASYSGFSDTSTLTVNTATVDHVTIAPPTASITAGSTQAYTLTAYDGIGNSWDVTSSATWEIVEAGHGGSWLNNIYTADNAGTWTVRGTYSGHSDDAQLTVNHASAASIAVTPETATITVGQTQTYTATATDAYGNSWDVSVSTTWEILEADHGGSWTLNVYTSANAGDWTVRGTYSGQSDTATLTVNTAAPQTIILRPNAHGTTNNLHNDDCWWLLGFHIGDHENNWNYVNEATSDGDSSYVYRDESSEDFDTYAMQDSGMSTGAITQITVHIVARVSGGSGTAREYIRIGGTNYHNPTTHSLTSSYVEYTYTWTTNPNTSSAWTWPNIDALECGVALSQSGSSGSARCTQVWLEVTYTP